MNIADAIAFVVFILLWLAYARTTDSLRFRNRVRLTRIGTRAPGMCFKNLVFQITEH